MSLGHSPVVSTTGLLLDLDATNTASLGNVTTNILTFPENFANAAWTAIGTISATANVSSAPDGSFTANKLILGSGVALNAAALGQYPNKPALSLPYTFSIYAKPAEWNSVRLLVRDSGNISNSSDLTFNLSTGSYSTGASATGTFTNPSSTFANVSNGWYRISLTVTTSTETQLRAQVYSYDSVATTGDGISGILIWGAQLEFGSSTTTYYPVNATTQPSTTWTNLANTVVTPNLTQVDVLVVAGGGGGAATGSGGGAGGLIYQSGFSVTPGTSYTATVGAGGSGGYYPQFTATNGANSVFGSLTAIGGGQGVSHGYAAVGIAGGSGGGAAIVTSGLVWAGGQGTAGQGNNGGAGMVDAGWVGGLGGGGGAGGVGSPGVNAVGSGNGGPGLAYDISGTLTYYAGGGGGGEVNGTYCGVGGIGGGGSAVKDSAGNSGTPNTGGGGAGGSFNGTYPPGGSGGSGIVIVRYPLPVRATGGTITTNGNYAIHTFTSGTDSFVVDNSNIRLVNTPRVGTVSGIRALNLVNTSQQIVNTTNINLNQDFTLECWVNMATVNGFSFFGQGTSQTANRSLHIWMNSATSLRFGMFANDTDVTGLSLTTGTWYHFAFTYSNSSPYTKTIYINGVAQTGTPQQTQSQYIGTGVLRVGSTYVSSGTYANGYFGVARVYSRVLSANQVLDNFNALRGRYGV